MTTTHPNDDLFHALATRARATSDGRLVLAVVGGLTVAIGIAVWRPPAWLLVVTAGVCAASFGAWGIADRELRELRERGATSGMSLITLRIVRVVSIVLGAAAAIVATFRVLGFALGTWIS